MRIIPNLEIGLKLLPKIFRKLFKTVSTSDRKLVILIKGRPFKQIT